MSDNTTPTVGKILGDDAKRDAIHMALAPVIANERLAPGQPVGFCPGSQERVYGSLHPTPIGIVDPFLKAPVFPDERFWMFLYPMTITSLRHEWEHPAFSAEVVKVRGHDKEASEAWLREFVRYEVGYLGDDEDIDEAVAAFINAAEKGADLYGSASASYITVSGYNAKSTIPSEFYEHVEAVTGRKIPANMRASHFSCSC